ncbi:MAG: radical SAM protein, partial [Oscillospiraceae bacterium]
FSAELAFFGGSFTAIDRQYMISLLQAVQPYLGEDKIQGIRISTRPDAIDDEVLTLLKAYGVTAIELGAQSMCERVLQLNRRGHTAEDVASASKLIKQYGFQLGLQMMVGLYGDTAEECLHTAHRLAELCPATIRIYPTVVIEETELGQLYRKGKYLPMSLDDGVELCAKLLWFFTQREIKVIRLGLHYSESLAKNTIAGIYHPAFRELCEGKIYFDLLAEKLSDNDGNEFVVFVAPSAVSKMTGQQRCNVKAFAQRGINIKVQADNKLKLFEIRIQQVKHKP